MTDTASKPMWTRCPGCKDRILNDKLDIGIHRQHCPADLLRGIQDLNRRLKELATRVDELQQDVAEPAIDLDDVAPWPDDDEDDTDTIDDDEDEPASTAGTSSLYSSPSYGPLT